jgi:folylpolyglutamate synthase/dihydropteroate synthase
MDYIIILTSILYILYLFYEAYQNDKNRRKIKHLIHVNGTRGKSSTSRLIEAGLRSGEHKIFCKTTGTRPMIIDVDGVERSIVRKSRPILKSK